MSSPGRAEPRLRVAIEVDPPLLGSAMGRVLTSDDVEVVVLADDVDCASMDGQYDVVVTSRSASEVQGFLMLRIGLTPEASRPVLDAASQSAPVVDIDELSGVLDHIDRWRGGRIGSDSTEPMV